MADKKISELGAVTTPLAGTEVLPVVQSTTTKKVTAEQLFTTTQPSGNANGIVQLNSSKIASTSASFFYDAASNSNFGINTSTVTPIYGKTMQLGSGSVNNSIHMVGLTSSGFISNFQTRFLIFGRTNTTLTLGTNDVDKVNIDLNGNTSLLTGNLVIGTAAKGIDFSANTHAAGMTSELLNDYEEGTWEPVVTATTGTLTTVTATGNYTKVGRSITVNFQVTLTNIGTASGALIVTLPYSAGLFPAIGSGREEQNTGIMLQARIPSTTPSAAYVLSYANGTVIATGNIIQCTITYFV